jgi:hypothetical protein
MDFYIKENDHLDLEKYYKFSIVRNPWDRLVSWYSYHTRVFKRTNQSFNSWVRNGATTHWKNVDGTYWGDKDPLNCQLWIINKEYPEIKLDFIGKFENLQQDFNIVCDKIGIPSQELPHLNKSKHKHYTEYYDDETKQIVAEKFAGDIEHFGYEFRE